MCSACRRILRNFEAVVQTLRTFDDVDATPEHDLDPSIKPTLRASEMAERWRRDAG